MHHPPAIKRLAKALLSGSGETSAELRTAIEARAASLGGAVRPAAPLPGALEAFVDKVACAAYKTTDHDFERLRTAGYGDDAVFEITLSAALGAAHARLERGMALLRAAASEKR